MPLIQRPNATVEIIQRVRNAMDKRLQERLEFHGYKIYTSDAETYGKVAEEFNKEALDELHANDHQKFAEELLDTAIAAFWGIVSSEMLYDTNITGVKLPKE